MTDELGKTPEDISAKQRQELWEAMGFPIAPEYLEESTYEREFKCRIIFGTRAVMRQYQMVRKVLLCTACMEERAHGVMAATRLFITIEDDVMTVFKAMGHVVCHRCGFEEWYPLASDPRPNKVQGQYEAMKAQAKAAHTHKQPPNFNPGVMAGQHARGLLGQDPSLQHGLLSEPTMGIAGHALARGMTSDEYRAMQNIYAKTAKAPPPKPGDFFSSREEAIQALAMASPEKRKFLLGLLGSKE